MIKVISYIAQSSGLLKTLYTYSIISRPMHFNITHCMRHIKLNMMAWVVYLALRCCVWKTSEMCIFCDLHMLLCSSIYCYRCLIHHFCVVG